MHSFLLFLSACLPPRACGDCGNSLIPTHSCCSISTVPATPAQVGTAGGTPSASAAGDVAGPDCTLLSFAQFQFVRHARINDLHQALNNNYGDTVADTQDIDQLFTSNRADIKGDADLLKAVRGSLIEKVVAPHATETSGADRAAVIKPTIDQASFKVSDPKGKNNVRLC